MYIHKRSESPETKAATYKTAKESLERTLNEAAFTPTEDQLYTIFEHCRSIAETDPDAVMEYLNRIQEVALATGGMRIRAELYSLQASLSEHRNKSDEALHTLSLAIALFGKLRDRSAQAKLQERQGLILLRMGKHRKALATFHRARRIWSVLAQYSKTTAPLVNISIIHSVRGDLHKALGAILQALEIAQKYPPEDNDDSARVMATIYNTIAGIYKEAGDDDTALEYSAKASPFYGLIGMRAFALTNIAILERDRGRYYRATRLFRQAQDAIEASDSPTLEGNIVVNLGELYIDVKKLEIAGEYLQRALRLAGEAQDHNLALRALEKLGRLEMERGRYSEALPLLHDALDLAQTPGIMSTEEVLHERLARVYEILERPRDALYHANAALQCIKHRTNSRRALNMASLWHRKLLENSVTAQRRNYAAIRSLKADLHTREAALRESVMALAQKNALLTRTRDRLLKIDGGNGVPSVIIADINEEIRRSQAVGGSKSVGSLGIDTATETDNPATAGWQALLPNGFQTVLVHKYPALTPTEIKVCCLIKAGLSPQECADTLIVSYRTIETHRRNIRKKMKIDRYKNIDILIGAM